MSEQPWKVGDPVTLTVKQGSLDGSIAKVEANEIRVVAGSPAKYWIVPKDRWSLVSRREPRA